MKMIYLASAALMALVFAAVSVAMAQPQPLFFEDVFDLEALMPPFKPQKQDEYLCSAVLLPERPLKLVGVQPLASQDVVHHMLLFGGSPPLYG
jgi:hypothetical protein